MALVALLALAPAAAQAGLSAPTGLAATAVSGSQIRLTWSDSNSSETGFAVERSLNGTSFTALSSQAGVNATSYNDSGLTSGVRYYYRIQALGNGNNRSGYSNRADAVTLDTIAPSVPTGLTGSAANCNQINLSWTASTDTGGSGLKGYRIYRNSVFLKDVLAPTTSASDTGLAGGTTYTYTVSAFDNANPSNFSAQSTARAVATSACTTTSTSSTTSTTLAGGQVPTKPTGLLATVLSCSQIRLSWNASSATTWPIAGYDVYRWTGSAWVSMLPAGTLVSSPHTVSGLSPSVTYYYAVEAVDTHGGRSGVSGWVSALISSSTCGTASTTSTSSTTSTTLATSQKPTIPTGLFLTVLSCSQIRLDWNASTGPYPIAGYDVYRWNGSAWASILPTGTLVTTRTYTNGSLNASTTYYYAVEAVDTQGGRSGLSGWQSAVTPTCSTASTTSTSTSTSTTTTLVNQPPVANAGPDQAGNTGTALTFNGSSSTDPNGSATITNYSWTFGDGTTGSGKTVTHAYANAGTYLATLRVQDSGGLWSLNTDSATASIVTSTATGAFRWNRQVSAGAVSAQSFAAGVAIDSGGNAVVVGRLVDTVDFGTGPMSGGSMDAFVAKYAPSNGGLLWVKRLTPGPSGGSSQAPALGVAVDASDNIVVVGYFTGSIDLGGGPLVSNGSYDIFVAKYSPSGAHLWSKRFGGTLGDLGIAVAIDGSGNIALTGSFTYSIDLGGGTLTSNSSSTGFLAKYSPSGVYLWSKNFVTGSAPASVTTDTNGNIVVTGSFSTSIDFGGGPLPRVGGSDVFVVKYSSSGAHVWSRSAGSVSGDGGQSVRVAPNGDVVVGGNFSQTIDLGNGPLTSSYGLDMFLVRYSANGLPLWSKKLGGHACGEDSVGGVAVDSSGNILLTGRVECTTDFGGGWLFSANGQPNNDLFVAKFDPSGGHLWSRRTGGVDALGDSGAAAATGLDGSAFFAGYFGRTADFGGGAMTSLSTDAFVVKFAP